MTVILHPGAQRDLDEAAAFYAREGSPAVAARFLTEVERGAGFVHANPGAGTPVSIGWNGYAHIEARERRRAVAAEPPHCRTAPPLTPLPPTPDSPCSPSPPACRT
ncbi:MAG: type II toxin-antitoxin system RelE/ParE family toxin [Proteobacteria bacterium]|nr:type II toxin-antitoxin system RelE/ParE family toxin [Pseudomonadota bacterium]